MNHIDLAYDFIEENLPDVYSKVFDSTGPFAERDEKASKLFHDLVIKLIHEDSDMLYEWADEKQREYENSDKWKEGEELLRQVRERHRKKMEARVKQPSSPASQSEY